jgi:hypothetical protein
VARIDSRSLARLGAIGRCPSCRGTGIRHVGVLRVCASCAGVFLRRDSLRREPTDVSGWVGGSDYDY